MTAPTPSALKLLRGTARPDRANHAEPMPPVGAEPPPWLPPEGPAPAAWDRLAPVLTETRVLTVADADALALCCDALAEYLAARDDAGGWRRADAAWKRYATALGWFGMNPTARTRVAAQPSAEPDALADWMASRPSTTPQVPPPSRPRRPRSALPPADALEAWERGTPEDPA